MSRKKTLTNWGNYPAIEAEVFESNDLEKIKQYVLSNTTILARGSGRSYGDAALNQSIFSTISLNRIHSFDIQSGIIDCDSGVTISTILDLIIPNGYFLQVTPGTKAITIGGAIAADVHGKNHHQKGSFSQCIISFSLMNEDGTIITCSSDENEAIYHETIGGMGLTGIILRVQFNLLPITSSFVYYNNQTADNLSSLMKLFERYKSTPYSVAWIDCLAQGKKKGRGVFKSGRHAAIDELPVSLKPNPFHYQPKVKLKIGIYFPSFALTTFSVKVFNRLFYAKNKMGKNSGFTPLDDFFYPLDKISNWNKIYGKSGFIQYQCVLPLATSKQGLSKILDIVSNHNVPPFLTVLKLFGKSNQKSPWSFPMEGYTLAMDFKLHKGLQTLIESLDSIVKEFGGRVYLAKDALSNKEVIKVPPSRTNKFSSIQLKRLMK